MSKTRIGSVDLETGELLPHVLVAVRQKIPNGFAGGWLAMSFNAASIFKGIRDIEQQRVFWALIERLDFENYINVVQADIARELEMQRPHVSRAIKELVEQDIILKGPKIGRNVTYRLNPNLGWRGSGKEHQKALRTSQKAKQAGLTVHKGGKASEGPDGALRAELKAKGRDSQID
jgi:hypothetical protein